MGTDSQLKCAFYIIEAHIVLWPKTIDLIDPTLGKYSLRDFIDWKIQASKAFLHLLEPLQFLSRSGWIIQLSLQFFLTLPYLCSPAINADPTSNYSLIKRPYSQNGIHSITWHSAYLQRLPFKKLLWALTSTMQPIKPIVTKKLVPLVQNEHKMALYTIRCRDECHLFFICYFQVLIF